MKHIDYRSDTVTFPPPEMKKAMFEAELGDDVYGDDPTVLLLEKRTAELLGKEAGVFVPTGCMGNQLALYTHTKQGQEIIAADESHIVQYEAASAAVFSKVQLRSLDAVNGAMDLKQVENRIRKDPNDFHYPATGLLCVQNPSTKGRVLSLEYMKEARTLADKYKLPIHLDGARIFNAAAHLGVEPKEIAQYADSVMLCFSKGLCCPIGSMVVGSKEFCDKVRRNRKMFGGGMRQVGILAAAGLWALDNIIPRIGDDKKYAQLLGKGLKEIGSFVEVDCEPEINMLFVSFKTEKLNLGEFKQFMLEKGIKISTPGKATDSFRFCTHYWVGEKEVAETVAAVKEYFTKVGAL
jgi:threonine aldolase